MEEQSAQVSAGQVFTIIITGIVVLAGLGGVVIFSFKGLVESFEEEMQDGFANSSPPSYPITTRVVDDIETLANFGYRKIDTVAHANAGDFIQFRLEDLGYEVEIQNFTTELCEN